MTQDVTQSPLTPEGLVNTIKDAKYSGIHQGVITDTADYHRQGKIKVFVSKLGAEMNAKPSEGETLAPGEVLAKWSSPFLGVTEKVGGDDVDPKSYEYAQKSYGFWMAPPDRGVLVLVTFINNDPEDAYILSCIGGPEWKGHMMPSIPGSLLNYGKGGAGLNLPVVEKSLKDPVKGQEGTDTPRPPHHDLAEAIVKQGLITDSVRGTARYGLRSKDVSMTYGISTPGPLVANAEEGKGNPKHRKGGHTFVMDDTPNARHIRLRSAGGNQILMDDNEGIIYLINKPGTAWIELSKNGSINIFGEGDMNIRSKGNFNMRSDRNVNIEAGRNVRIKAAGDMKSGEYVGMPKGYQTGIHQGAAGAGGDIRLESTSGTTIMAGTNAVIDAQNGDASLKGANKVNIDGRKINIMSTVKPAPVGDPDVFGGITIEALGGPLGLLGTTGLNLVGTAGIGLTGVPILLNSPPGLAGIPPLKGIPGPSLKPLSMQDLTDLSSTPPEYDRDSENILPGGGIREDGATISTIVGEMLTAEPYAGHYKSDAAADANQYGMTEDLTADSDPNAQPPADSNDPAAGYKAQVKQIMNEVVQKRIQDDQKKLDDLLGSLPFPIPGLEAIKAGANAAELMSNFNIAGLKGNLTDLLNYEQYLKGLIMPSFSFNIPTLSDLLAGRFGYALTLPDWMSDMEMMMLDVQNRLAELEQFKADALGQITGLAGAAIGEVAGELGIDNMKSVGDFSGVVDNLKQETGLTSEQLNQKVSDISNSITGGGD